MASTVQDLLEALSDAVPLVPAADWDPVGLQLGDPAAPANRVAVCHEVTDTVLAEVEAEPLDFLVAYHPLLFEPTTRLVVGTGASGRAYRLARSGVSLLVVHTAFDAMPGGAADALATALELQDVHPIWVADDDGGSPGPGRGSVARMGRPGGATSLGELAALVASKLDTSVRIAGPRKGSVGRVAVIPGSGSGLLADVADAGADVIVTGDVTHHRAVAALDLGLAILDAGHVSTELPGLEALYAAISQVVPDAVDLTGIDVDPWREI